MSDRPKKKRRRYLTDKGVGRLAPDKTKPFIVTDTGARGLAIKVTPLAKKVWILNTVFPGHDRQSKRTIGEFSKQQGVAWARQRAIEWREQAKKGVDPTAAEKAARQELEAKQRAEALRDKSTFGAFAEKYAGEKTNRRAAKDRGEIRNLLIASPLGPKPIHEILPADVRGVIDNIKVHSAYQAVHAWSHADQIFKMAVHEGLITASPMASLIKRLVFRNVRIVHRQRSLSDDELVAFWRATARLWHTRKKRWRISED